MSGFSSRNVQYPRYQDTDLLQLCPYPVWARINISISLFQINELVIDKQLYNGKNTIIIVIKMIDTSWG